VSRKEELLKIAPMLEAIGEHGMARDARDLAADHTGISASWCPTCGSCTCPDRETTGDLNDDACLLHGLRSVHCEADPDYKAG
jgi:hypothetical protein